MINDYIEHIFDSFLEIKGDRKSGEDKSVPGGLAYINDKKVVVIGYQQVISSDDIKYPEPEGYRKSIRLMAIAETFNKPVITFIDILENDNLISAGHQKMLQSTTQALECMLNLKVPVISVIMGKKNSALTLDLCASDRTIMLDGASCTLYTKECEPSKDKDATYEFCLNSDELIKMNIVDRVVKYSPDDCPKSMGKIWRDAILDELNSLAEIKPETLIEQRFNRLQAEFLSLKNISSSQL
jgi:acetyl-CoA carboxylase alpha subunit